MSLAWRFADAVFFLINAVKREIQSFSASLSMPTVGRFGTSNEPAPGWFILDFLV